MSTKYLLSSLKKLQSYTFTLYYLGSRVDDGINIDNRYPDGSKNWDHVKEEES